MSFNCYDGTNFSNLGVDVRRDVASSLIVVNESKGSHLFYYSTIIQKCTRMRIQKDLAILNSRFFGKFKFRESKKFAVRFRTRYHLIGYLPVLSFKFLLAYRFVGKVKKYPLPNLSGSQHCGRE